MELIIENQIEVQKTEFGAFPKDWRLVPIKELCKISTGDKNTEDKINDGKYPFFVRSANVERINSYSFDGEAVLTAGDGVGTGKIFHYINGKFDYHQRVYKMSDFSSQINGYYFYLCFSNYFYDRVMGMTAKSSVDSVRMEMIADMKIPLPPTLEEQQTIAESLSDVDELTCSLDELIQKKEAIKKGAMQQLLTGIKRVQGFDGEWEVKKIKDISPLQRGYDLPKSKLIKGNFPVVYSNGIGNYHSQFKEKGPGVVTGRSGTLGNITYVEDDYWPHNTSLWVTDFKSNIPRYIYYLYSFINLEKFGSGSGVPTLNRNDVHEYKVAIPVSKDEQYAIVKILDNMDRELQTLRQKREKYVQIKQGMMQELLTGRTRLV